MRIITKFDIRNNNVVKGINYEGVECVGKYIDIYNKVCNYVSNNINKNFEIILNDVTASLYNIKSGEKNIKELLDNKHQSLPHICSGGVKNINDLDKYLSFGCDRIMINTVLHDRVDLIKEIVEIYGAQILIPTIETRYVNGHYYVYKSYGRDDTNIKLVDWIQKLKSYGIIEILIISMDKDGTLQGYDEQMLIYLKQSTILDDKQISVLYAGGIKNIDKELIEIEERYPFVTGISVSTLFYKNIEIIEEIPIKIEKFNVKKNLYFLSYLKGNIISVIKHFSKIRNIILVNSIKDIPKDSEICINGHYNTYELIIQLKNNGDFYILKKRLIENSIKYLGICAGLQLLLEKVYDEFSDKYIIGLDIIKNCNIIKLDSCHIGFFDNKFYCHSYALLNNNNEYINEYINDNIQAYQYHPENSLL